MKQKLICAVTGLMIGLMGIAFARPPIDDGLSDGVQPKIAWYSTLQSGLAEAQRSQRPILLISAAPQCLGVPGTW